MKQFSKKDLLEQIQNTSKSTMTNIVLHEIRNRLMPIIAHLELLESDEKIFSQDEALKHIRTHANQITDILNVIQSSIAKNTENNVAMSSLDDLPEMLQHVCDVPHMFFGNTVLELMSFMSGLKFMYSQFGIFDIYQDTFNEVIQMRGWSLSAHHPYVEMQNQSMSVSKIINEVITIEIEVWKSIFEQNKVITTLRQGNKDSKHKDVAVPILEDMSEKRLRINLITELRAPITVISGYAHLIEVRINDITSEDINVAIRDDLQKIREATQTISQLINDASKM